MFGWRFHSCYFDWLCEEFIFAFHATSGNISPKETIVCVFNTHNWEGRILHLPWRRRAENPWWNLFSFSPISGWNFHRMWKICTWRLMLFRAKKRIPAVSFFLALEWNQGLSQPIAFTEHYSNRRTILSWYCGGGANREALVDFD